MEGKRERGYERRKNCKECWKVEKGKEIIVGEKKIQRITKDISTATGPLVPLRFFFLLSCANYN